MISSDQSKLSEPQAECEEGISDVLVTDNRISIIRCLPCYSDYPADH